MLKDFEEKSLKYEVKVNEVKILYKNRGATGFLKFRKLNFTRH